MSLKTKEILNKWTPLLEGEGLPEIADPRIPLPAELDSYYPNWANAITLPNNLAESDIKPFVAKALNKLKEKEVAHA